MATYFEWAEGYNSYAGTDVIVTAQLSYLGDENLKNKCYVLGSLQTISISTFQDKKPVRAIGNINAIDYVMGQRTIAGSLVFAVFDRHFADEIFNDLKVYSGKAVLLTDEIPPLDLTIVFANEYGKKSKMVLYGVRMISEGQVMSVNDLYTENTYQFVAVGMEPLTAQDSEYAALSTNKYTDNDYENNSNGSNSSNDSTNINGIKDSIYSDINNNYKNEDSTSQEGQIKYTFFDINQPISQSGYGIVNLDLENKEGTNIYVIDKSTNNEVVYNDSELEANGWHIQLPQGDFIIKYVNTLQNEYSNSVDISIKYEKVEDTSNDDYVIINYVTNDSIYLESNNSSHDTLIVEDCSNNVINEIPIVKNKAIATKLKNDNLYKLYTSNRKTNSKINYVKTLAKENEDLLLLIEYIKTNKNLWVNDFSDFDFDLLNNDGLTVLDKVIKIEDNSYKSEILLYTIKLQNELINAYNSSNNLSKLINYDLLNIKLKSDNEINKVNIYNATNNSEYFKYTIYNLDNNSFIGDVSKRYIYQPVFNNIKGVKYNYCFLKREEKDKLKKYNKTYFLENQSLDKYKNQYVNYDDELLRAILVSNKNCPDKNILDGPAYSYGEELTVDVNYKDVLKEDESYYLCIGNIYDVLNNTPIRKVEFSSNEEELIIPKNKTGILNNNYYLLWVEDSNFQKISLSTITSTYNDSIYLQDYIAIRTNELLKAILKILTNSLSCSDLLNSIYFSVCSYNQSPKNIIHTLEQELINQGYYSFYSNSLDSIFYTLLKVTKPSTKKLCDLVKIDDENVTFINPKECTLVRMDYYLDEELPVISKPDSFEVSIFGPSVYTVLYLRDNNMTDTSGFILVNNYSNKTYTHEIEVM